MQKILLVHSALYAVRRYELYPMDIVQAGDEFYAAMKRSTNGGGENSPVLTGEDDPYELFFAGLQEL